MKGILNDFLFFPRRRASFNSQSPKVHKIQKNHKNVFACKQGTMETDGARKNYGPRLGMEKGKMQECIDE